MWNNFSLIDWQSLWKNVSYRRLAIAISLSFLLHLFLIGQFNANLTGTQDEPSQIEARLVLLPAALPKPVTVKPISKAAIKSTVKSTAKSTVKAKQILPSSTQPAVAEFVPVDLPVSEQATAIVASAPQVMLLDEVIAQDESNLENAGLELNSNAYRYVETEFDVRTNIDSKVDSSAAGKAKIVYQLLPDGEQYQLTSLIQAKGLAALLVPDLLQTSDGVLNHAGLQPKHYLYQFGGKKNKTFSADFDWEHKQLNLHSANGDQTLELSEGTQDLLSFMYQFMFVTPLQNMRLSITNGKKIGTYDYSFEGEETIATKMGNLSTIHLMRMAAEGEKKTELWLALDYQYVPVKIRETEKQGKVYELLVTSLKTEMPAPKLATP